MKKFVFLIHMLVLFIEQIIPKSEQWVSIIPHNACKEARQVNNCLIKQVRFMENRFLNATEIPAQEADYLNIAIPANQ